MKLILSAFFLAVCLFALSFCQWGNDNNDWNNDWDNGWDNDNGGWNNDNGGWGQYYGGGGGPWRYGGYRPSGRSRVGYGRDFGLNYGRRYSGGFYRRSGFRGFGGGGFHR